MKPIIKVIFILLPLFATSCEKSSEGKFTSNPMTHEQPERGVISVSEILEVTHIPDINFADQSVLTLLSYVEDKCNVQAAMMGEKPIEINAQRLSGINMDLKAPVMTAKLILDVVSVHSRILYEIDEKERTYCKSPL